MSGSGVGLGVGEGRGVAVGVGIGVGGGVAVGVDVGARPSSAVGASVGGGVAVDVGRHKAWLSRGCEYRRRFGITRSTGTNGESGHKQKRQNLETVHDRQRITQPKGD